MEINYEVHVIYNPKPSDAVIKRLEQVAKEFGIPVDKAMQSELNVVLDHKGYMIWLMTMCAMDPTFGAADRFWSKGEYFVSSTGDSYLVKRVRKV